MRGNNIINIYIIEGKELNSSELNKDQLLLIETYENRCLYNGFRNRILEQYRDYVQCCIKIILPHMVFDAYDEVNSIIVSTNKYIND